MIAASARELSITPRYRVLRAHGRSFLSIRTSNIILLKNIRRIYNPIARFLMRGTRVVLFHTTKLVVGLDLILLEANVTLPP